MLLLTDLSLAAVLLLSMLVADLQAKLPERSVEGASAGTFARGTRGSKPIEGHLPASNGDM